MDNNKKICAGCRQPIGRRYFTMYTEDNKEAYLCPKCRKIWEKKSPYSPNREVDKMNKNNEYADMCRDFIDHNKKLYCEGTFSRNEYWNICFGYLKAMRACQHISEDEEKVLLDYM